MDAIDTRILTELELDGRLSFSELGDRVGLSKSPCWTRVQNLEADGIIGRYRAELDMGRLGLDTVAFVQITVAFDKHADFEQAIAVNPLVLACHATVGEGDYLLQVATPTMVRLDRFLRAELWKLPGVQRFTTTITMRTIKQGGALMAARQA